MGSHGVGNKRGEDDGKEGAPLLLKDRVATVAFKI